MYLIMQEIKENRQVSTDTGMPITDRSLSGPVIITSTVFQL